MSKTEHFIIIGLNPSLISEILTISKNINPIVDICGDFSSFNERRNNSYDLYIFTINILDKDTLDFLNFLQTKEDKNFHTIAIIGNSLSEEDLNQIRNKKIIDEYVFNSLKDKELDRAFNKLFNQGEQTINVHDRLFALKLKYDHSIGEKIELITDLIHKTKINPENINSLKSEIHKIGGTAGSFGYPSVSSLCKDLEREIIHKTADGTYKEVEFLDQLDVFLKELEKGFQKSDDASLLKSFVKPTIVTKPLLYIVDDDVHFLSLIERIKDDFFFDVIVEFDPEKARYKLSQEGFNPTFLIVSETFGTSSIKGFDLIVEEQMRKTDLHTQFFGLLLVEENIDIRMEALQKNINYIFRKPISAPALLNSIAGVLENKMTASPKVLIVDDDKDFSDFATLVLAEIGVSSFAISESSYLFKALEEYRPDILLLDVVLPKYDGLNLLKTLRQDIAYKHLIIIIVTSSEQADISSKAYSANVDDVLFKPIDRHVLQKRVLNLMDRRVYPIDKMIDNMTGLPREKEMMFDLQEHLKKADYLSSYLVLFEIQNFSNWIKENGYSSIKDLLIYISNQLAWISDYTMKCYLFDTAKFALIIEGSDSNQIKNKIHQILSEIVSKEKRWHLSFNCSIVPISKRYLEVFKILSASNEALIEASNLEPNVIKMVTRFPKGETCEKKEIVIVDSDVNLLRILKNSFSSHGIIVHTFSEGGDALKEILAYGENRLPALIIVERKLQDMDGMDLFVRLKNRFRTKIPCIMLTVFSSDKDVSDGLNQGVLEYILKPFNISIFIQKALRIINQN